MKKLVTINEYLHFDNFCKPKCLFILFNDENKNQNIVINQLLLNIANFQKLSTKYKLLLYNA